MADQTDIADVIKNIQADVTAIVRGEIELAKAELMPQAKAAGIGAGLFGVAAVVGLTGLTVLLLGFSFWLSFGYQTWFHLDLLPSLAWGFATIAVIFFLVAAAVAIVGKNQLTFTGAKATTASTEATVAAVKGAVGAGLKDVQELSLTGRRPELEA
jgi:hypothetical protein